jgi:hypothetical protein
VDTFFIGDWDEVQVQLGLQTTQQLDDKRRAEWAKEVEEREKEYAGSDVVTTPPAPTKSRSNKQAVKKKAKAKMAKASRKRNKARK